MRQVLFELPLHSLSESFPDLPVYGYGFMLFLAFVACTWLASFLARRQGIAPQHVQDLAVWVFVTGIIGARVTYMLQYRENFTSFWQFFAVWDGGLVFYGSFIGGLAGFLLSYKLILVRHKIPFWKMADVIAPCLALGLALGRVGCLLNGCCYGNVAPPDRVGIPFPMAGAPRMAMTSAGHQTDAGFTMDERARDRRTVGAVEPDSPAEAAGLRRGDVIVEVNGQPANSFDDVRKLFGKEWPRGKNDLSLTVAREVKGKAARVTLELIPIGPFEPWTIRLHPTQVYESVSMALLLVLILAFMPFRTRDGEAIALFMVCYGVHRFLNEMLRVDTEAVALGMTLSQNISILIVAAGVLIWVWLRRQPAQYGPSGPQSSSPQSAATADALKSPPPSAAAPAPASPSPSPRPAGS